MPALSQVAALVLAEMQELPELELVVLLALVMAPVQAVLPVREPPVLVMHQVLELALVEPQALVMALELAQGVHLALAIPAQELAQVALPVLVPLPSLDLAAIPSMRPAEQGP